MTGKDLERVDFAFSEIRDAMKALHEACSQSEDEKALVRISLPLRVIVHLDVIEEFARPHLSRASAAVRKRKE